MSSTKRVLIISIPILIALVAGGVWVVIYGPPIIRDRQYRELITDFQRAQRRDKVRPENNAGWDFEVQVTEKQSPIRAQAFSHLAVVGVKYEDESDVRALYKYVDYSHPREIRTAGTMLYVYWTEILFDTKDWLMSYDLTNRREIVRRRIDRGDVAQSQ